MGIITISGGNFLSEIKYGDGKVIFCAVDAEGGSRSTFPYTGIFPITLFRSASYLSAGTAGANISIKTGESTIINIPKKYSNYSGFNIADPNGHTSVINGLKLSAGTAVNFPAQAIPGNYTLSTPNGKPVAVVSVNIHKSESDFTTLKDEEIKGLLKKISSDDASIDIVSDPKDIESSLKAVRIGTELWKLFIVLAVLCLVAEMFVAKNTKAEAAEE